MKIELKMRKNQMKNEGFSLCLSLPASEFIESDCYAEREREFENGSLWAGVEFENGAFWWEKFYLGQSDFILGHILGRPHLF